MIDEPDRDQNTRHRHIARVHCVARDIGITPGTASYRSWLKRRTGHRSCADLTAQALLALTESFKVTHEDWSRLSRAVWALGYEGFEDARFHTIVHRVTGADNTRLLSRPQVTKLLAVLYRTVNAQRRRATTAAYAAAGADATDRRPSGAEATTTDTPGA